MCLCWLSYMLSSKIHYFISNTGLELQYLAKTPSCLVDLKFY